MCLKCPKFPVGPKWSNRTYMSLYGPTVQHAPMGVHGQKGLRVPMVIQGPMGIHSPMGIHGPMGVHSQRAYMHGPMGLHMAQLDNLAKMVRPMIL